MSEWKEYKLGEIGVIARGKSKHRPRDAAHLYGGNYPFIQTGDVKAANHKLGSYNQSYSEAGLLQSKLWPIGTICITIAANIADTAILSFPACFPDSVIGFIPNKNICNVDFIEYLLQYYRLQIRTHSIGSVQDNINLGTFEKIKFRIPDLPTQTTIAEILSSLDDKIELNSQINKYLEILAQTLFKQWFIDFEFPNDNGEPYCSTGGEMVDSELGEIPKGWKVGVLEDVIAFSNGYAFNSRELLDKDKGGCFHVFKMGHIKKGGGLNANGTKSYFERSKTDKIQKYILKVGDLLMCMTDMKGNVALLGHTALMNENDKYIVNQRVGLLRPNNDICIDYPYLYILTNSNNFIEDLRSRANSGAQVNLSTSEIKNSKIVIPPKEINLAFDIVVKSFFNDIFNITKENDELIKLRDTLLPKLISGELEVSDALI